MRNIRMFIVDDEWIIAESLSMMEEWSDRNISIVGTAYNGYDAIRFLQEESVDLVITDIRMPDINGLQLLQYIYEELPDTKVIMISGYEDFSYARQALKYKARGYVLKPIDTDELLEIVDEIIKEYHSVPIPSEPLLPRTHHESIVIKAKHYVQSHLNKPISLSDVADYVKLTPHYFGQIFKNESGMLFTTYLTQTRMEKACELLTDSKLKIYEVCEKIGYLDSKYFSKVFQKTYGITPNEFRQNKLVDSE